MTVRVTAECPTGCETQLTFRPVRSESAAGIARRRGGSRLEATCPQCTTTYGLRTGEVQAIESSPRDSA